MVSEMVKADRTPKVSIGLPVFNGEKFLSLAIESVLSQEFGDLELIIADNASTDGTAEICRRYADQDQRVKYVRHPKNIGAARNYNYVFHCGRGEYFNWLASDDLMRPGFLRACLDGFEASPPSSILVYPNFDFMDEQGAIIEGRNRRSANTTSPSPVERLDHVINSRGYMIAIFGLFRRDLLRRTRLIDSFASSDFVLLAECALLGPIIRLEGDPLFLRRLHSGTSRQANPTPEEVAQWFDPDALPYDDEEKKIRKEYLRSVFRIDELSPRERLGAAALLARNQAHRKWKEKKRILKQRLKKLFPHLRARRI